MLPHMGLKLLWKILLHFVFNPGFRAFRSALLLFPSICRIWKIATQCLRHCANLSRNWMELAAFKNFSITCKAFAAWYGAEMSYFHTWYWQQSIPLRAESFFSIELCTFLSLLTFNDSVDLWCWWCSASFRALVDCIGFIAALLLFPFSLLCFSIVKRG